MHFRHTSAKIQPKNLKQHFNWEAYPPEAVSTMLISIAIPKKLY